MIVKNIIINACKLMNKKDVISYLNGETECNDDITDVIDDLLLCVNMANNSIATNYIPIKRVVKVNCTDGKILFKTISDKCILDIYSVKKNGIGISNYTIVSNGLILENGTYEIEYSIFPDEIVIDGQIDCYLKMNEIIFAQLVLSEYYFLKGFNDEAIVWDNRFNSQMKSLLSPKKSIHLPEKRWL